MKFHSDSVFVKTFTRQQELKHTVSQSVSPFSDADIDEFEKRAKDAGVDFLKLQSNCGYSDIQYVSHGMRA